MLGEALALSTALIWAVSTVLSAEALKKVEPILANAVKTFFSTLAMLPIAFAVGELNNLPQVNLQALLLVVLAAIIGMGIGDTLLFKSIVLIGVSRAYTIAYTSPLFTMVIAVLFLGEPFHLRCLVGTILIVLSIVMVSMESNKSSGRINFLGVLTAVATAFTWAIGTALVTLGLKDISVILANSLRFPVLSFFLFLISRPRKKWNLEKRDLAVLSASGILGMVVGGITFLSSIQFIGASRASSLGASAPIWVSIISSIALKEKVTPRLFLSSITVVIGIYFLI